MDLESLGQDAWQGVRDLLGYLNFSRGTCDPRFLDNLNQLYGQIERRRTESDESVEAAQRGRPTWRLLAESLRRSLAQLRGSGPAFREVDQAEAVLDLLFDHLLPAYRRFHADLLLHQTEEMLIQPLFIGRAAEAILAEGGPWQQNQRIVDGALGRLNDFVGYRPVAVLQNGRKLQPYEHEWVCPIPLYIEGAGVAFGPYHDLIEQTWEILGHTDPALLRRAWFDPALLEELALDPRAFDFDHPVHRRPNYHFGTWDPHRIDNRGFYRRFVVQQVTVDALLERVKEAETSRHQALFEAAAVLAGTILMGSGISGSGPDTHDSQATLATLLPHIAAYRDDFYEELIAQVEPEHAHRLRLEAQQLRQPFGGARQDLNQKLARRRADQLQHVHLARAYARMGYTRAAQDHAQIVAVPSARMRCQIDCFLAQAHLDVDRGRLAEAAGRLPEMENILHRAIGCGALVDPWNILGFGGQFSLFPALENSIPDHRVDELIDLVSDVFDLYARLEKEAAAAGMSELQQQLSRNLEALAGWWDQFASTEVSSIEGVSGRETWESAAQVATALAAWKDAGTAAGDVAFWRPRAERFRSPKAYALVVEALLEKHDPVGSMALLMHWLGSADNVPLAESDHSLHELAVCWMEELWDFQAEPAEQPSPPLPEDRWKLTQKFFDHLEANAEHYWEVPRFELPDASGESGESGDEEEETEEDADNLFRAAYEGVTYRDTTDDGFDAELLDYGEPITDFELSQESERIAERLAFLVTVARLWKLVAVQSGPAADDRPEVLTAWFSQACTHRQALLALLQSVQRYRVPPPRAAHESLVEYDQRRGVKEFLLDRVIGACVEMDDAARLLLAALPGRAPATDVAPWEQAAQPILRAAFEGDVPTIRAGWDGLLEKLSGEPLLYIPSSRGGHPQRAFASRSLQRLISRLLDCLPRLGLLRETYQLLQTVHEMERNHPVGPGAITEFDRLFDIGSRGIVRCLVASSKTWNPAAKEHDSAVDDQDRMLIDCLEKAVEVLLKRWLAHSRAIRISVLEGVAQKRRWDRLKQFIQRWGHDLFTQYFMNLGNLRAIWQRGVDEYLRSLEQEPDEPPQLVAAIDREIPRQEAVRWLEMTIEAVSENYPVYIDYNSTTTQSDHGELLYTLLDFLRLLAGYDRVAWNLKPVVTAHEVLVRSGRIEAAALWRAAVEERTAPMAKQQLARYEKLARAYGMRLPSVAERLGERFIQPLVIDRLRALVEPAMDEWNEHEQSRAFSLLEQEVAQFTARPGGVGFEAPPWLEALETEVDDVRLGQNGEPLEFDAPAPIPQIRLPRKEALRQIADADRWTLVD